MISSVPNRLLSASQKLLFLALIVLLNPVTGQGQTSATATQNLDNTSSGTATGYWATWFHDYRWRAAFENVGTVKGQGNTSSTQAYSYADGRPLAGTSYRLRQVDTDGGATYSSVAAVQLRTEVAVYPTS